MCTDRNRESERSAGYRGTEPRRVLRGALRRTDYACRDSVLRLALPGLSARPDLIRRRDWCGSLIMELGICCIAPYLVILSMFVPWYLSN